MERSDRPLAADLTPSTALGRDGFAYLRACVSGVSCAEAARRYLSIEPGAALRVLHRQWVDQLRAFARREGDPRWALLAVSPRQRSQRGHGSPAAARPSAPTPVATWRPFEDWVVEAGWEDWSQAEQLEAYAAYRAEHLAVAEAPLSAAASPLRIDVVSRAEQRLHRLAQQQLALLQDLEPRWSAAGRSARAQPEDPISAWFDPLTATRLGAAGLATLGQLQRAVQHSARWYRDVKAVGEGKARRIEALLSGWLAPQQRTASRAGWQPAWAVRLASPALDGSQGRHRAPRPRLPLLNDAAALDAWLGTLGERAVATRIAYRREVERWQLWCVIEQGQPLSSCDLDGCRAYLRFLADVPAHWQSRRLAERHTPGWTPFRGPLAAQSRRFAVRVLHLFCEWLVQQAGYLTHNPWAGVEPWCSRGSVQEQPLPPHARVLPAAALKVLHEALPDPACPGSSRNGLLLTLCSVTGLRASELLAARMDDVQQDPTGQWTLTVLWGGRQAAPKRRIVLPHAAVAALTQAVVARGATSLSDCPGAWPLLMPAAVPAAVTADTATARLLPLSYSALHRSFRRFVAKAVRCSHPALDVASQRVLRRTTQQWLRHTFATRAAADHVPVEWLRHHLGHADASRVRAYYRRTKDGTAACGATVISAQ